MVLGKTTVQELAARGKRCNDDYACYVIDGINFWYDKSSKVFDHLYITYSDGMPSEWAQAGLSFDASYNEWLRLLKNMQYDVKVTKVPTNEDYRGQPSFTASTQARSTRDTPLVMELDFTYSRKVGADARGTLYSIRVKVPG